MAVADGTYKKGDLNDLLRAIGATSHYDIETGIPSVNELGEWGDPPLTIVISWNDIDAIRLLLDNGADVNARGDMENTALHKAALLGLADVVRFLLERGADTALRNHDGDAPLDIAKRLGHDDIVRILNAGASPSV